MRRLFGLFGRACAAATVLGGATALLWTGCSIDISLGKRIEPVANGGAAGAASGGGGMGGFIQGTCENLPGHDDDNDGFTPEEGDCNDCNPNQNPNAVEVPTTPPAEPVDEDCDGLTDEIEPTCDHDDVVELRVDDPDPLHAAWALDVCKTSRGPGDWGLVSSAWTMPNGAPPPQQAQQLESYHRGHGLLDDFGPFVAVQRGVRMLALSGGSARRPTDPGFLDHEPGLDKGYTSAYPPGFPKPSCGGGPLSGDPHDAAALEVVMRSPSNARGIAFDFDFYTMEWPQFICTSFNDLFLALLDPAPLGSEDGNISFDEMKNVVSVNNAFLEVCGCDDNPPNACMAGGKLFECSLGDTELLGNGYGFDSGQDHASTSWLSTRAPVDPDTVVSLRFAIYDSADGLYDSLVLVDNLRWIAEEGGVVTTPVPQ